MCGGFVLDLLRGRFVFGFRSNFGTRASSARFATKANPYESWTFAGTWLAFNAATIGCSDHRGCESRHPCLAWHTPAAEPIIAATNHSVYSSHTLELPVSVPVWRASMTVETVRRKRTMSRPTEQRPLPAFGSNDSVWWWQVAPSLLIQCCSQHHDCPAIRKTSKAAWQSTAGVPCTSGWEGKNTNPANPAAYCKARRVRVPRKSRRAKNSTFRLNALFRLETARSKRCFTPKQHV